MGYTPLTSLPSKTWLHFWAIDDTTFRNTITAALVKAGIATLTLESTDASGPSIIFFKEISSGLWDLIHTLSHEGLERVLVVAIEHSTLSAGDAWHLLAAGASDVFAWDGSPDPAGVIAARLERWEAVDKLLYSPLVQNNIIGSSPSWLSILRQIVHVARFTDAPLLIMGETGTGKELVAQLIHALDYRPEKRDLVLLDCTTIVQELSGSEFYGHERGAFTGAVTTREGAFAQADGGTLFLDEIGELPMPLQAQLLRVVQEHTYKRIGSNAWRETHFRLVCATNRDLLQEVKQGRFRSDLYYRISSFTFTLPPLNQRVRDIIPLAQHFLREIKPDHKTLDLDEAVREYLLTRSFPGNVRDLKQLISRIAHRHVGPGPITIGDIPEEERPVDQFERDNWRDEGFMSAIQRALALGLGIREVKRAAEETAIQIVMHEELNNIRRAAKRLGITDRALQLRRALQRRNSGGAESGSLVKDEGPEDKSARVDDYDDRATYSHPTLPDH